MRKFSQDQFSQECHMPITPIYICVIYTMQCVHIKHVKRMHYIYVYKEMEFVIAATTEEAA